MPDNTHKCYISLDKIYTSKHKQIRHLHSKSNIVLLSEDIYVYNISKEKEYGMNLPHEMYTRETGGQSLDRCSCKMG